MAPHILAVLIFVVMFVLIVMDKNRAAVCVPWLWTFDDRTGVWTGHAQ